MIYRDVFLLVFIIPCILSILLAYLSGKSERILSRILLGRSVRFLIGLVLASDLGFRMLQSDPDATDAAFNDTAPVGTTLRLATCIHLLQHYLLHDVDTEADQKVKGIGLNRSTIKQHHPSMPPENLIEIIQQVQNFLSTQSAGHGWDHIHRVRRTVMSIHAEEGGDPCVVELAALLHDIGDAKFNDGQERSGELAHGMLQKHQVDPNTIRHIVHIIENLSFRKRNQAEPLSHEGKIVQDADRLDALGAIGIGEQLNTANTNPSLSSTTKSHLLPRELHFKEKLFKLKDLLNTASARRIADQRVDFMRLFLQQYFDELQSDTPDWVTDLLRPTSD